MTKPKKLPEATEQQTNIIVSSVILFFLHQAESPQLAPTVFHNANRVLCKFSDRHFYGKLGLEGIYFSPRIFSENLDGLEGAGLVECHDHLTAAHFCSPYDSVTVSLTKRGVTDAAKVYSIVRRLDDGSN